MASSPPSQSTEPSVDPSAQDVDAQPAPTLSTAGQRAGKRSRSRGDRGAVLVEFALVATILLLLGFATFELGAAWSDSQQVTQAARSGARGASQLGIDPLADSFTVQAVEASLGDLAPFVTRIVIYDAAAPDGSLPGACVGAGPPGVAGLCSVYDGSAFGTYGSWTDGSWPPSARDNTFQNSDYVGVQVTVSRSTLSNFIQYDFNISDVTVMRIEPEAGS